MNSRQPYIYTMPEGFMKDQSVPIKWRLYGVINGFWISGKSIYAGNTFFAEKLECTNRHIRRALAELETEGYLKREVKGTSRLIVPNAVVLEEDLGCPPGGPGMSSEEDAGGPHISDSISESKSIRELEDSSHPQIVEVSVSSDSEVYSIGAKSPRLSPDKRKAYDELIAWSENERGFKFPKTTILLQYKAFKLANENQIPRERLIEMWEEMACDKFWQKAGFDWMNVVQQCLKKPV